MSLRCDAVSATAGERQLLRQVSLSIEPGSVHAILGPNGAGKSSLLKLLSGDLPAQQGQALLDDRPLSQWTHAALARRRAVLPQEEQLSFGFLVEEVVALGRLPCPRHAPAQEAALIREALDAAGVAGLWGRRYTSLSGGEKRRVQLARVLAQVWEPQQGQARYLLLDEPTASLDLTHQHACLRSARRFAAAGNGVAVVLHDPNLALAHADRVSLLDQGQVIASGTPAEVITAENLQRVFAIEAELLHPPGWTHAVIATRAPDSAGTPPAS